MKRKIEIKDLEKTLKENISTKSTETSGPEKTIEVSDLNIKDKKYVDKDQGVGELVLDVPDVSDMPDAPDITDITDITDETIARLKNIIEKRKSIEKRNSKITDELIEKYPNIKEDTDRIISSIENDVLEDNMKCRTNANKDIRDGVKKLLDNTKYDSVENPKHYNIYDTEVVKMMELIFGPEKTANWAQLNAFKYRMRMGLKPTAQMEEDFKKEQKCLKIYEELKKKLK